MKGRQDKNGLEEMTKKVFPKVRDDVQQEGYTHFAWLEVEEMLIDDIPSCPVFSQKRSLKIHWHISQLLQLLMPKHSKPGVCRMVYPWILGTCSGDSDEEEGDFKFTTQMQP
eukprot:Gb_28572 [translate_table: standard]